MIMLCDAKREAIIQWHNAVTQNNTISSITELQDGYILQKHVKELFLHAPERVAAASSKNISFFKEADSKASFAFVKKYLDVSCHVRSEELIDYEECVRGVELEIAKVEVLALCLTVTQLLRGGGGERLELLYQLDTLVQQEIWECVTFVMDDDREPRRADFNRILGRSVTVKERTVRMSCVVAGPASPAKSATQTATRPKGRPRKYVDYETSFTDEGPRILLQAMESPKVKAWSTMAWKEREVLSLRGELEIAENKMIDQRLFNEQLRSDLDKKDQECQRWKEKFRTLQDEMDSRDLSMDARNRSMEGKSGSSSLSRSRVTEKYEGDIASLKKEVDTWRDDSDDLRSKLERYREREEKTQERLRENESQLQLIRSEKESLAAEVERLREELKETRDTVSVYRDKLREMDEDHASRLMEYSSAEVVGDILEEDAGAARVRSLDDRVHIARQSPPREGDASADRVLIARLSRLLEEKTALCERLLLQAPSKSPVPVAESGRGWMDAEGGDSESEDEDGEGPATGAMKEIVRLAERVFAAHREGPPPELPKGGDFFEEAERAKRLLAELLVRRPTPAKAEGSEEASRDSGMFVSSDPGSVPSSGEEEPRRPDPFRPVEEPARENPPEPHEETLRVKEEYEKKNGELSVKNEELTESLKEASLKLKNKERDLEQLQALHKFNLKKYSKLKAHTEKVEEDWKAKSREYESARLTLRATREELLQSRTAAKDLKAALDRCREARDDLGKRAEASEADVDRLRNENRDLRDSLEEEKYECKQMKMKNKELQIRQQFNCEVVFNGFGVPETSGASYPKMQMYRSNESAISSKSAEPNESVLSGNPFNKSLHSTLVAEDEDLLMHHTRLPGLEWGGEMDESGEQRRMQELAKRNSLYKPHLRSSYIPETQGYRRAGEEGAAPPPKKKVSKLGAKAGDVPDPGGFPGNLFKTPRNLVRLVQRREEERKRKMGIKRPRIK